MAKMLQQGVVLASLVAGLLLAGCGNRMPAAPLKDEVTAASEAPVAALPSAAPATLTSPQLTGTLPGAVGANPALQAPITGSLVVSNLSKTKKGILFKNMVVKASVVNTSQVPLSGTVKIEFKDSKGIFTKTLETVETKTIAVANLAPGGNFPIDVTSDETGIDEVEVTVETNQPSATAAPMATGFNAAAAGQPYGTAPTAGAYGY